MKFLYLQDYQIIGKNSVHYIGNYFEDCMKMLDEILSIAKKENCEALLDGGDLLDAPCPSYKILDEIADRIEIAKIPMFSLFGNHAERYHSMEHSQYTGLAHLIKRSQYFNTMEFFTNHAEEMRAEGYEIIPIEYSHDIEENIKENGIQFKDENQWKIVIAHAFICPKKFPFATHVVCDDIKTNADVVLVAHYHSQWEKKVGNTLFKDIGCLGRTSITERNIEPTVLIIDTAKRELKEIKLKSAKPGEEIFDLTKVQEVKEFDAGIERFIKSIESASFQATNIEDSIKIIGKEKKVDKKVIDLIINKLGEV